MSFRDQSSPFLISILLCLTVLTDTNWAQTTGADSPTCNSEFALQLVQQQVLESKSVVEPPKRIKILLRSANFLWKFDEPTARSYFAEAFKAADDLFKESGLESKPNAQGLMIPSTDHRIAVLNAIARKDAGWAKKLSDKMLADLDKDAPNRKDSDKTREAENILSLATQLVRTDKDLSRSLIRSVVRYPLTQNWYWAFYTLHAADPAFAASVYSEALIAFRNAKPRRQLFLSAYPFASMRILGVDRFMYGASLPTGLQPNLALQRQFMEVFFARITSYAANEAELNSAAEPNYSPEPVYMVSALNEIEPFVIRDFPELLQRFSETRSTASSLLNDETRKQLSDKGNNASTLASSFEERFAAMEKADSEGKLTDNMIVQLVTWFNKSDEQFAKLLPWLDKIKDENVRRESTIYYWFLRSKLAITDKRVEDAEKFAAKVPELDHRSVLIFELATDQLKNINDTAAVFETLNQLSKLTRSAPNSVAKAQVLLSLSAMYERVNHSVALDELGEAIRVANNLKDIDLFQTNLTRVIKGKDFAVFASYSIPGFDLEKTFRELSKRDFEMSLANAKSLDDRYYRTIAVIAVAENCVLNEKRAAQPKTVE